MQVANVTFLSIASIKYQQDNQVTEVEKLAKDDVLFKSCKDRNADKTCQAAKDLGVTVQCRENQKLGWCPRMTIQKRMLYRTRSEDFAKALQAAGWTNEDVKALREMAERGYNVMQARTELWNVRADLSTLIDKILEDE
jgi:hypothetical protein